jgi:hypothetical protein
MPEANMQDRRKLPRKDLMSYSQVFDVSQGKLIGYLGDLNLIGAMVIGDESLKVMRNCHLHPIAGAAEDQCYAFVPACAGCMVPQDLSPNISTSASNLS